MEETLIFEYIRTNNIEELQRLKLNNKDEIVIKLFRYACDLQNLMMIKYFIENIKLDIKQKQLLLLCPIIQSKNYKLIKYLLNFQSVYESDFDYMIKNYDKKIIEMVVSKLTFTNYGQFIIFKCMIVRISNNEQLFDTFKLLLEYGFNISACNENKESIIHLVCRYKDIKCLKFMIKHKADLLMIDNQGNSALSIACRNNNKEMFNYIKNQPLVNSNIKSPLLSILTITPLRIQNLHKIIKSIVKNNWIEELKWLFSFYNDKSAKVTLLSLCCMEGNIEMINYLIDFCNSSEPHKKDYFEKELVNVKGMEYPIFLSIQHTKVFKLLMKYNADINMVDEKGNTLLHKLSSIPCSLPMIKLIKKYKLYTLSVILNNKGESCLYTACKYNNIDMIMYILNHFNFLINIRTNTGYNELKPIFTSSKSDIKEYYIDPKNIIETVEGIDIVYEKNYLMEEEVLNNIESSNMLSQYNEELISYMKSGNTKKVNDLLHTMKRFYGLYPQDNIYNQLIHICITLGYKLSAKKFINKKMKYHRITKVNLDLQKEFQIREDTFKLLLSHGSNIKNIDNKGNTLLHSMFNKIEYSVDANIDIDSCVQKILDEGLNINHLNKNSENALHKLYQYINRIETDDINSYSDIIYDLIENSIDIYQKSADHKSIIDYELSLDSKLLATLINNGRELCKKNYMEMFETITINTFLHYRKKDTLLLRCFYEIISDYDLWKTYKHKLPVDFLQDMNISVKSNKKRRLN